ncbi:MAG: CDP-alcohol phosphatidyltransferase family protein [Acidobacteriota bacterium]
MASAGATMDVRADRNGHHVRQHGSLLAGPEKRALVWMAKRMPGRVNSDHLSALGLAAMVGVGLSFWLGGSVPAAGLPLVVVFLALNWFGDSLDGTLARVRNRQRPRYGFYVDHVIDITGTTVMIAGLALGGFLSWTIALAVLSAWLLVSAESFLATHTRGIFRMSFGWFGPTELRILIAIGAIRLMGGASVSPLGHGPYLLFDIGAIIATAGMVFAFLIAAVCNTIALYREETERRC